MTTTWRNSILIVPQVQVGDKQEVESWWDIVMSYVLFSNHTCKLVFIFVHTSSWMKTPAYKLRESLLVPTLWICLHISSSTMVLLKCHSAGSIESIHLFWMNEFRLLMPQALKIWAKQVFYAILGNGHIFNISE